MNPIVSEEASIFLWNTLFEPEVRSCINNPKTSSKPEAAKLS